MDQPPTGLLTNRLRLLATAAATAANRSCAVSVSVAKADDNVTTGHSPVFPNRNENRTKPRPDFSTLIKRTHIEGGLLCAQGKQSFSSEDTDEQDIESEDLDF